MAIFDGARPLGPFSYEWDISGNCEKSVAVEAHARPPREWFSRYITVDREKGPVPVYVLLHTRCRQCAPCLRMRRRLWEHRANEEVRQSSRTWFGTITLEPDAHYRAELEAARYMESRAVEWTRLDPRERFLARHRVISIELTKWLKRVRKESGAVLRYLVVAEAHESGLPHYHCLIHERHDAVTVTERTLRRQWPHGFTKFKLVDCEAPANYVCKYLSKSSAARVRASLRYGTLPAFDRRLAGLVTRPVVSPRTA